MHTEGFEHENTEDTVHTNTALPQSSSATAPSSGARTSRILKLQNDVSSRC